MYCNYQQNNWESLLPLAEFSYNNTQQSSSKQTPFFSNYAYDPITSLSHLPTTISSTIPSQQLLSTLRDTHRTLSRNLAKAIDIMKQNYDKKVQDSPDFRIGDFVWILRNRFRTQRPSDKLDHKRLGPFKVLSRHKNTYTLDLPPQMRIHPVFDVSVLEPHHPNTIPDRLQPPPPPEIINEQKEFVVKEILDSKVFNKTLKYFVDWEGYDAAHRSWEPAENLSNTLELVAQFHTDHPNKPAPSTPIVPSPPVLPQSDRPQRNPRKSYGQYR